MKIIISKIPNVTKNSKNLKKYQVDCNYWNPLDAVQLRLDILSMKSITLS